MEKFEIDDPEFQKLIQDKVMFEVYKKGMLDGFKMHSLGYRYYLKHGKWPYGES